MTEKLYWEDSYIREFNATVTGVNDAIVELDKTGFYPTGGGEPNDTGKLILDGQEFQVIDVSKQGENIFHKLDREGLKSGDNIRGVIDWERRHKLMRMHTAAHLLSAIIHNETGALISGNKLDLNESRIDFNLDEFDREKFTSYIAMVNELIRKDAKVKSYFMKREDAMKIPAVIKLLTILPPNIENLRIVEIEGIDTQADGGNHVKNISELGRIEIVKLENKGKNNRRMYFTLK